MIAVVSAGARYGFTTAGIVAAAVAALLWAGHRRIVAEDRQR